MAQLTFVVVCMDEDPMAFAWPQKHYTLASTKRFHSREAAEAYAATVAPSRMPMVVSGSWHMLENVRP